MSSTRFFIPFLIGWPALVCTALTIRITMAAVELALAEYAVWCVLAGAPVATYLVLKRSRPSAPVTSVLYDADHAGDAAQNRRVARP